MTDEAPQPLLSLVNGCERQACATNDRGLMYGDGVFRTLRMVGGRPVWLDAHLNKLESDCARLGILPPARAAWQPDLIKAATRAPDATVKLVVTRGVGQRGYKPVPGISPTRIVTVSALSSYPADWLEMGVHVHQCALRLGLQPQLAGVKHLNRLENVLARMEWSDPSIAEGVLCDSEGNVISGVSSNVFILQGNALLTPRLHRCGVAGVARQRIMGAAAEVGLELVERDLQLQEVLEADALMFSNSVIKLWWANRLGERRWTKCSVYPVLRGLLDD